ncbi:hypothetical protein NFI95_15815 [Acetobacteraceae bacterium KSS8]|uniref:Uncharacterized protein n=1 Tax=Endosaccharibacter trunci TaxID=2812733 RepID=A0ABT1WAI3_9PROT|nr:hypothetical protein [Acetobacteraceae bacterium KSS8]
MKPDEMVALRPKADTSAAIDESLSAIEAARVRMEAERARLDSDRPRIALEGTAKQIADARASLLEIDRTLAELVDLKAAVEAKRMVIQRDEFVAEDTALCGVAERAISAFHAWMKKEYATAAQRVVAGIELELKAGAALYRVATFRQRRAETLRTVELPPLASHTLGDPRGLSGLVRLPAADGTMRPGGDMEPIWFQAEPRQNVPDLQLATAMRRIAIQNQRIAELEADLASVGGGLSRRAGNGSGQSSSLVADRGLDQAFKKAAVRSR